MGSGIGTQCMNDPEAGLSNLGLSKKVADSYNNIICLPCFFLEPVPANSLSLPSMAKTGLFLVLRSKC